jgi:FKBP-type peptidyl-prolyl cis-trans isomerase FklB
MKFLPLFFFSALLLLVTGCQSKPARKEAVPPPIDLPTPAPESTVVIPPAAPRADSSGFVTTASGLRYRVLASGPVEGRSPSYFDSVTVHYRGTLTDGTVFDSSIERGVPSTFGVGQVIAGWSEALRLMKPGDQWELFIPSRLAYGNRAVGDKIPPNSDLIFKVALIQVVTGQ